MPASSDLTATDQHVLLATLRLHPNGYGVSIRDEIEQQTGRTLSFGTLYAVLERLTANGYLASRRGEPTAERGGRAKLYFTVTAPGQAALQQALRALDALRCGTALAGVTA